MAKKGELNNDGSATLIDMTYERKQIHQIICWSVGKDGPWIRKKYETQKRKGGTTTGIQNVKKHDLPQQKSTNLFLIAEPEWISPKFSVKKNPIDRDSWDSLFAKTIGHATTYWKVCANMFFLRGKAKLILWWPCSNYVECIYIYIYLINQRKLFCDLSPPKTKTISPLFAQWKNHEWCCSPWDLLRKKTTALGETPVTSFVVCFLIWNPSREQ